MIRKIIGILLIIAGLFLLLGTFQAINCEHDGACLGMEWWFSLYNFDNIFIIGFFVVIGIFLFITGGLILVEEFT